MNRQEIIKGMEEIMGISIHYANPNEPYLDDWHSVYLIAESICNDLKKGENDNRGECNDNKDRNLSDEEVERIIDETIRFVKTM